jgi:hypothetical protein
MSDASPVAPGDGVTAAGDGHAAPGEGAVPPGDGPDARPAPEPLDPPMVPFAVAGMAGWAVAGLVLLGFRGALADHGHTNWLWICLAGVLLGVPGLSLMIIHDRNRRRRRAATSTMDGKSIMTTFGGYSSEKSS